MPLTTDAHQHKFSSSKHNSDASRQEGPSLLFNAWCIFSKAADVIYLQDERNSEICVLPNWMPVKLKVEYRETPKHPSKPLAGNIVRQKTSNGWLHQKCNFKTVLTHLEENYCWNFWISSIFHFVSCVTVSCMLRCTFCSCFLFCLPLSLLSLLFLSICGAEMLQLKVSLVATEFCSEMWTFHCHYFLQSSTTTKSL